MSMNKKEKVGACCAGILFLLLLVAKPVAYHSSSEAVIITVTEKERINTATGETTSSKYLIFTDEEVFENTDKIIFGKWNSSDVQGKLKKGKTYNVKVAGWRIPFFSSYRNIIKVYGEVR